MGLYPGPSEKGGLELGPTRNQTRPEPEFEFSAKRRWSVSNLQLRLRPFDQIPMSRTRGLEKQRRIGRVKERKETGKAREVNKVSCSLPVRALWPVVVYQASSVQLLSHIWLFVTPWTAARQVSLSITNSQCLLKFMSIESVMSSHHLIFCRPLLLLTSIFPSIRVFSNESVLCIRWPKYWIVSFSISPSNEYSGLISFRIDWLDLFAVQGILKSLLQHCSSKPSVLQHSAFSIVQLSHPYMTTGKP